MDAPTHSAADVAAEPTIVSNHSPRTLAAVERELKLASVVTVAFGLFVAIASHNRTDDVLAWILDLVFFRAGEGSGDLPDTSHLADAIAGGVMVGWGITIWLLVDRLIQREPSTVKAIVGTAIPAWFVVDSLGSIASGGWINAVANLSFLVMFLVPLRKI